MTRCRFRPLLSAAAALALASACSNGPALVLPPPEAERLSPDVDRDGPGAAEPEPLYLIGHTVYSPDSSTSYLTVTPSLAGDVEPDLSRSLEFSGAVVPYALPGTNKAYVSSAESGTMTEVTFDASGYPAFGTVLSFANFGFSDTWGINVFVSATKAYHINQGTLEVVVWNPEDMTIRSSPSLRIPRS